MAEFSDNPGPATNALGFLSEESHNQEWIAGELARKYDLSNNPFGF